MANRSSAPGRLMLMGLIVAGGVAGMAGSAAAQYYYYYDAPYPLYGYGYRYDYGYVPRAPAPVSRHAINRIAARDYGLVRIERSIRRDDTYILDGVTAGGQRQRLILDAYAGELIRRIPLRPRPVPAPGVARVDPREDEAAPRRRLTPQPPERPAALKPPGEASAPATTAPPPPPAPAKPAEAPPAEAAAPAPVAPTPEAPSLPPVQQIDPTPSTPRPETPIAPVAPLD